MTVIARRIVSEPIRLASQTWQIIVGLLAPEHDNEARGELLAVTGIASSLIVTEAWKNAPVVVYGSGPRVRIYCLYGENAVIGDGANETALVSSPLQGDWSMSLPASEEDLGWVQAALKKRSQRITARDMNESVKDSSETASAGKSASVDIEAFLRP